MKLVVPTVAMIIFAMTAIEIAGAVRDSQTNDEGAHLVSGYCEWTLREFRLDPPYPPFGKLLQSLPLVFLHPAYVPSGRDWIRADEFALGREFLYRSGVSWRPMLLSGRIVTVAFTVALALMVFLWTRRRYGGPSAVLAVAILAFDPLVLAHGHIVSSDVPVTLLIFAAWIAWDAWLRRPTTRILLTAGVLAALAAGTKYSGLILIAVFPVSWLLSRPRPSIPLWRGLACLVVTPALVILTLYAFDTRSVAQDPILAGRAQGWFTKIPIPGYYFFRGFHLLYRLGHGGHLTSFLGQIRYHSTPLYFPVAFLVKMPTGTLATCAFAAVLVLSRRVALDRGLVSLLGAAALIFLMGIASPLDIGFRHIMPVFPFLFIFCGAVIGSEAHQLRAVGAVLIALLAAESVAHTPNFIPFFNRVAGGSRAGHRYLLDSNVDWGQDLNRLADWVRANHPHRLCLSYFGSVDVSAYGIDAVLTDTESANTRAGCDVAAVSQELMYGLPGDPFLTLRMRQPDSMAGMLYIYRLH